MIDYGVYLTVGFTRFLTSCSPGVNFCNGEIHLQAGGKSVRYTQEQFELLVQREHERLGVLALYPSDPKHPDRPRRRKPATRKKAKRKTSRRKAGAK